ncbi:Hypothetical_protein [Hexamita inflata]|uniref:Hypothetical_protein n=1 Tax=Hexamita inflata TaxID=28002 RepID=A0AA86QN50_9EUKA|nr:Hypothetical protein HINF_LOCUS50346 [Hexamita inflata]
MQDSFSYSESDTLPMYKQLTAKHTIDINVKLTVNMWEYLDSDGKYKGPFCNYDLDIMNQNGDLKRMGIKQVKCGSFQINLKEENYCITNFFEDIRVIFKDVVNASTQTGMDIIILTNVIKQEIFNVEKYENGTQYEIINTDLLKDYKNSIQYERTFADAVTQTGLSSKLSTQTRSYFQKLVITPTIEQCVNTELSLRRGYQDLQFVENVYYSYREIQ